MDHRHRFDVDDRRRLPGGLVEERGRCVCGLEERRRFMHGLVVELRYRTGLSRWVDPVDVLTLDLPVSLCGVCRGRGCARCRNLGVVGLRT